MGIARFLLPLCAVLLPMGSGVACLEGASEPAPPMELTLAISGMHCDDCAVALTQSLRAVDGVLDAEVSLKTERAKITVLADRVDELRPELASAVTGLGYGAEWKTAPRGEAAHE